MLLLDPVKRLILVLVGDHFGSIAKQDDSARPDPELTGSVQIHIIVVRSLRKSAAGMVSTVPEFSCRPVSLI